MAAERVNQIFQHLTNATPSLKDKVCIVTGAGSVKGIGRATVIALAKRSPKVIYATDLTSDNLQDLANEVAARFNVKVIARAVDAASEAEVEAVVKDALENYGRLDVFYANAGMSSPTLLKDQNADSFMKMMRVNALSAFLACKHAGAAMTQTGKGGKEISGGSVICTASVAGIRSGAGSSEYSASKAAVINLCQTSAYQYGGTNVRFNALCPGLIETGMTTTTFDNARKRGTGHKIGQLNPQKRYGLPSEIANVVAFIASDEASYMNGQAVAVDGGLSASHPIVPGRFH